MDNHPFKRTVFLFPVILLLCVLAGLLGIWLLVQYQPLSLKEAAIESACLISIWLITLYYSWYVILYVKVWQAKLAIGLFLQCLTLSLIYILVPLNVIQEGYFLEQLPFLAIIGSLIWIIGIQWYVIQGVDAQELDKIIPMPEEPIIIEKKEVMQTLSVKDGTHIHIIPVEEIYFIQACGDYVNIFTQDGQFIKEQTMKSLEATLPDSFIRIHRSTIINSIQLLRIELFGKENYHVQLKNGAALKASLTGYKLLKGRLHL